MPGSFSLIIEDDAGKQIVVPFARDVMTIGRKEGNTIRLTERNVSRFHAKLLKDNGSVVVEDLSSFNGVKINGDRIAGRVQVAAGDVIEIGDYHLELRAAVQADTQKMGPAGAKTAGLATSAAAQDDEFEGDTQRWEQPAGGPAPIAHPTQEDRADFGDNNGDTERLDLEKLSSMVSGQGQSWPPPEGRSAPVASVMTTAELEPTARQPIADVPPGGLVPPPPAPPTPVAATPPMPMTPLQAPVGLSAPANAPTAPHVPAPSASPPALADDAASDATQDMPMLSMGQLQASAPAARSTPTPPQAPLVSHGHHGGAAEQTEQLRAAPSPSDDVSQPRLVVLNTIFSGSTFPLRAPEHVLGRTDDNDIVLEHRSVSRNHAKLVRDGERVRILDLKSANGVLVNGEEVEQHVLRSGDVIELGRVKIRFVPVGERFAVSPEEIERARLQDVNGDDDEPHSQTLNVAAPLRGEVAPTSPSKPVALYAVLAILVVAVLVLGAMVVFGRGGNDAPPVVGAADVPATTDTPAVGAIATAAAATATAAATLPAPTSPREDPAPTEPVAAPAPPAAATTATAAATATATATDESNTDVDDDGDADGDGDGDADDGAAAVAGSKVAKGTKRVPTKKPVEPPLDVGATIKEGQGRMLHKDYQGAVPLFQRVVAVSPNNADAHFFLGICYSRLRKPEKARPHLKTYLKLQPYGAQADQVRQVLEEG